MVATNALRRPFSWIASPRARPSDPWNPENLESQHIRTLARALGTTNLVFWQIFVAGDALVMGYVEVATLDLRVGAAVRRDRDDQ